MSGGRAKERRWVGVNRVVQRGVRRTITKAAKTEDPSTKTGSSLLLRHSPRAGLATAAAAGVPNGQS